LLAERLVLFLAQIEYVDLTVVSYRAEHSRGVRRPHNVSHRVAQIECEHGLAVVVIPDLDCPVSAATGEDAGVEVVPADGVDRHVMRVVGVKELGAVVLAALVDLAFLRSHQEQVVC